jgi:hypothetical protein
MAFLPTQEFAKAVIILLAGDPEPVDLPIVHKLVRYGFLAVFTTLQLHLG